MRIFESLLNTNFVAGSVSSGTGWTLFALGGLRVLNLVALTSAEFTLDIIPSGHRPKYDASNRLAHVSAVCVSGSNKAPVNIVVRTDGGVQCFVISTGAQSAFTDVRGTVVWSVD